MEFGAPVDGAVGVGRVLRFRRGIYCLLALARSLRRPVAYGWLSEAKAEAALILVAYREQRAGLIKEPETAMERARAVLSGMADAEHFLEFA